MAETNVRFDLTLADSSQPALLAIIVIAITVILCKIFFRVKDTNTPLHLSAERGDLRGVVELIAAIKNANNRRASETQQHKHNDSLTVLNHNKLAPIHLAAQKGHTEVVKALVMEGGVDVDMLDGFGGTPLFAAVMGVHLDTVKASIALGADVNAAHPRPPGENLDRFSTPLHAACTSREMLPILDVLLHSSSASSEATAAVADLTAVNSCRQTPLHVAALYGMSEAIAMMGAYAKSKSMMPSHSSTAAQHGGGKGKGKLSSFISPSLLDVNARDFVTATPMYHAAVSGHTAAVEALIALGADPNAGEDRGLNTPLHAAARNGRATIIRVLLNNRQVRRDAKNKAGETALDEAEESAYNHCIALLKA